MSECLFCKIIHGSLPADVVYEDELCLAFKDIHPKANVHLLVIPKKHIKHLTDLDAEKDAGLISHIMLKLPEIASAEGLNDGFRTIINTGSGGGQEVYHLHIHLLGGGLRAF